MLHGIKDYLCVVKPGYLILAFYVLALAIHPCSDENTCVDEKKFGISVDVDDHAHTPAEQDICSPLCICACCSAHVQLTFNFAPISFVNWETNAKLITPYREPAYLESSHTIFQPPKA